ncbi:hypothetical protein KY284_025125 [Solanum tuberosum]|nr:hypothetical protein KY284_025125 [Solanum tuberosum]
MDYPIVGDKNSDDQAAGKSKSDGDVTRRNYSMDEEVHRTNISTNFGQKHNQQEIPASLIDSTTKHQVETEELNCRNEQEHKGTDSQDQASPNGQKHDQRAQESQKLKMQSKYGDTRINPDQNEQQDKAGVTTLEVIEVESSSPFSFGVKPTDTLASKEGQHRPGKTIYYANEIQFNQMQEQHAGSINSQSKESSEDDTQTR